MEVPLKNIFVVSNDIENCQLFNKYQLNIEESKLKKIQQIITESNIHIQVTTSTDRHTAKHKITGKIPVLALCEYDFDIQPATNDLICKSLGLGKESIGIMIDHSLKEWGFSEDANDPFKRLCQLKNVNPALQTAILGKKSFEQFIDTSSLYTSYARPFILSEYVKNVVVENAKEKKKLVFVLPKISLKDLEELKLNKLGIKSLKVVKFNYEGKAVESNKCISGEGKKIKVVSGQINYHDMITLFKAAIPKVVVTGDQSLSEAISANLNFIYAAADHKRNLKRNLERLGHSTFEFEDYQTFRVPQIKNKDLTECNQNICSKYDYLPNFKNVLHEIFNAKFETSISLVEMGDNEEFISAIEKDKTYIITNPQICKLEIQMSTCQSKLPQFSDSIFEYTSLEQRYLLKRKSLV
jgi:hypothetical protein